jgi:hypothetical protein
LQQLLHSNRSNKISISKLKVNVIGGLNQVLSSKGKINCIFLPIFPNNRFQELFLACLSSETLPCQVQGKSEHDDS